MRGNLLISMTVKRTVVFSCCFKGCLPSRADKTVPGEEAGWRPWSCPGPESGLGKCGAPWKWTRGICARRHKGAGLNLMRLTADEERGRETRIQALTGAQTIRWCQDLGEGMEVAPVVGKISWGLGEETLLRSQWDRVRESRTTTWESLYLSNLFDMLYIFCWTWICSGILQPYLN